MTIEHTMREKLWIFILLLLIPFLLRADIWDGSSTSFYSQIYIRSVFPILLWVANLYLFVRTWRQKRSNKDLFWTVNSLSIVLALFSAMFVIDDKLNFKTDDAYGMTLIFCVWIPLCMSVLSIVMWPGTKADDESPNR